MPKPTGYIPKNIQKRRCSNLKLSFFLQYTLTVVPKMHILASKNLGRLHRAGIFITISLYLIFRKTLTRSSNGAKPVERELADGASQTGPS